MVREIVDVIKGKCKVKYPNISFLRDSIIYEMLILRSRMHSGRLTTISVLKNSICDVQTEFPA